MATKLLLIEGFDGYASMADMVAAGKWAFGAMTSGASLPAGRLGGKALRVDNQAEFSGISKMVATNRVLTGFAYYWGGGYGLTVWGAFGTGNTPSATLDVTPMGYFQVFGYNGGTANSAVTMTPNSWNYIEVDCDRTTGHLLVRLNGEAVLDATVNMSGQGDNLVHIRLAPQTGSLIDDIYMLDGIGGDPVLLGDVRVETFKPTSTDTLTGFAVTGAASAHAAMVDGDDGTYISSSTPGDKAVFDSTDALSTTPLAIHGVGITLKGSKSDAGVRTLKGVLVIGGTEYQSPETLYLPAAMASLQTVWAVNPAGGLWDRAAVEAAKFGVVVNS